jgi:hypothetical protein
VADEGQADVGQAMVERGFHRIELDRAEPAQKVRLQGINQRLCCRAKTPCDDDMKIGLLDEPSD